MQFRPCIDIHNGRVKQIVGATLKDASDSARENFVSEKGAEYYAALYKEHGLKGGHIIMLNAKDSPYYEATRAEAVKALKAYPGGMQIGGGINAENAEFFLENGASHVIVTSALFDEGELSFSKIERLSKAVLPERLVFDLSAKCFEDGYHIMTDRWQTKTEAVLSASLFESLGRYCDEFLIHAVDVEGSAAGMDEPLIRILKDGTDKPVTYAGGVHSLDDIRLLKEMGEGRIHVTVGSALDLFGGYLSFDEICRITMQI